MPRIFISYSRVDRPLVDDLVPLLREVYELDNVWFDENLHGGQLWWEEILNQIAICDIFIYLLSNESVASEYCLAEYEEAKRIHKQILPIQVRSRTIIPDDLKRIQFVDMSSGIARGINKLHAAITKSAAKIQAVQPPPITPYPISVPSVTPPAFKTKKRAIQLNEPWAIIIAAVITGILGIFGALIANGNIQLNPTPEPTLGERSIAMTVVAQNQLAVLEANKTITFAAIMTSFVTETSAVINANSTSTANAYTHTPTTTASPSNIPTQDYTSTANAQATLDKQGTLSVPTNTSQPSPTSTQTTAPTTTATVTQTQSLTPIPNVGATQTNEALQFLAAQANALATQNAQQTVRVTSEEVNLRNGPGANYSIVTTAFVNETFPVIAQYWNGSNTWYLVQVDAQLKAWVSSIVVFFNGDSSKVEIAVTVPSTPQISAPTASSNPTNSNSSQYTVVEFVSENCNGYDKDWGSSIYKYCAPIGTRGIIVEFSRK